MLKQTVIRNHRVALLLKGKIKVECNYSWFKVILVCNSVSIRGQLHKIQIETH